MTRKFLLMCVTCVAFASTSLMALGLGEIKLKSGLNQPLDAEIILLSVRGESNEQLSGNLGSIADFDRSGIERVYFLSKIRFETITKADGQKVLHLSTKEAVKEPFLNFLVNLEWPNGRLLREYTLLLDPPIFDEAPKVTVAPAKTEKRSQPRQQASQKPRNVTPKPQWQGDIYGPTSSSDTLWGIAAKVRPDRSVSMQQAMVTIFEANPDAFMRGNINNLKRGAEIKVPDSEVFSQISQRDALRMIAVHNDNWKSGKRTQPRVVMDTSSQAETVQNSTTTTSSRASGRLSLSADDSDTGEGGSTSTDAINEEENEILKQENEALQEKALSDTDRIQQLERLIELKNEQLASLQNRDTEFEAAIDSNSVQAPEIVKVPETAKPELVDVTPKQVVQPQKNKESSIVDNIMAGAYNLYLAIAGGVVLLLLIISIVRRRNDDVDYQDAVAVNRHTAESESSDDDDSLPEIADDILAGTESLDLDDFDDSDVDTDMSESDPLGEADIYIAYGKFEQAESLLQAAIENDSERIELKTKLLECYAEMDDQEKFESEVAQLSDQVAADPELGAFVEDLYQTAWPEGNLYPTDNDDFQDADNDLKLDDYEDEEEDEEEFIVEESPEEESSDADNLEELPSTEDVFGDESADEELVAENLDEDIEEDTDVDEDSDSDEDSDIDTQLDLARAYVEMGDFEGTREIIEEIMESGTEKQCAEAKQILDSIDD